MREKRNYVWPDGKHLSVGEKTLVMGILNVTPDSFSDGGRWNTMEAARSHLRAMIEDGADFIDVGAESTRPGGAALLAEEETERLFSFLPSLLQETSVAISVDTYHWQTAEKALSAGAHILNDVWGFQYDGGEMAQVCATAGVPVVLMHNRTDENEPGDIMEILKNFRERAGRYHGDFEKFPVAVRRDSAGGRCRRRQHHFGSRAGIWKNDGAKSGNPAANRRAHGASVSHFARTVAETFYRRGTGRSSGSGTRRGDGGGLSLRRGAWLRNGARARGEADGADASDGRRLIGPDGGGGLIWIGFV